MSEVESRYFKEVSAPNGGVTLSQVHPEAKGDIEKYISHGIRNLPGYVTIWQVRYPRTELDALDDASNREDWDEGLEISNGSDKFHIEGTQLLEDGEKLIACVEANLCTEGLAINIVQRRGIIERPNERAPFSLLSTVAAAS